MRSRRCVRRLVAAPGADAGVSQLTASAVDADDSSTGDGSPANPFPSIATALQHLGSKTRVYVCDGLYREHVALTAPVSLYGGLSCTGGVWRWDGGATQVLSPTPDYALSIAGLDTAAVAVEDIAFIAPDATSPGGSSVAAIVSASSVTLTRVVLAAGRGANGADGGSGSTNWGADRGPGTGSVFMPGTDECRNGDSSTGGIGSPIVALGPATDGTADPVPLIRVAGFDGKGGALNVDGDPGADGQPRASGGPAGNSGALALAGNGWLPSPGTDGSPGQPGQGGGGGGGWEPSGSNFCESDPNCLAGHGGSAGGCGGAGGLGGGGGGGSIALLSNSSTVNLVSSTLTAGQGGAGGVGGPGQDGQPGDASVPGVLSQPGLNGGAGGAGAGGSGGGGGSGGVSVGIVYRGAKPVADAATGITPASPAIQARAVFQDRRTRPRRAMPEAQDWPVCPRRTWEGFSAPSHNRPGRTPDGGTKKGDAGCADPTRGAARIRSWPPPKTSPRHGSPRCCNS